MLENTRADECRRDLGDLSIYTLLPLTLPGLFSLTRPYVQTMGKAELVDVLKEKTGISKKDVEIVLTAFLSSIREEVLEGGKEIRLRDFGTFKQKVSLARVGRNPRTGEELQISGGKSVAFSVSSSLKEKDEISKSPKPAAKKAA